MQYLEIKTIKSKFQDKEGIPQDEQLISKYPSFYSSILDDNKTLKDYEIYDQSKIYLIPKWADPINYYIVNEEGKKLEIKEKYCPCCCNTLYLKKLIKDKLGIDEKYQILKINGKILEDSQSLKDNIFDGKEVHLSIKNLSVTELIDIIKKCNP